jgi:peptidoglycan/LPS O-acetylase OafA/YrhL
MMKTGSRNIPSLDGLRAISVLMVVAAHTNGSLSRLIPFIPSWLYSFWGTLGVETFFVISGFLITHLLLQELHTTGTVSLKRFYFRRALRIFPPFYVYMAVALTLTLAGFATGKLSAFVVAGTYTWNYLGGGSHLLEHTWSLSLEEQFYLLWPAALVFFGARKSVKLAVWVVLLSPVSRMITYVLAPTLRALLAAMLHTGLDSIMFGCLLALLWRNERFNRFVQPLVRGWVAAVAASFILILGPVFRTDDQRILPFANIALCCAGAPLSCGPAAEHSCAVPPGRDLIQPLLMAANVYSGEERMVFTLVRAGDPGLR